MERCGNAEMSGPERLGRLLVAVAGRLWLFIPSIQTERHLDVRAGLAICSSAAHRQHQPTEHLLREVAQVAIILNINNRLLGEVQNSVHCWLGAACQQQVSELDELLGTRLDEVERLIVRGLSS